MIAMPHLLTALTCGRCAPRAMIAILLCCNALVQAAPYRPLPYRPVDDAQVLADIPASARHTPQATRELARSKVDVALRLAQLYITQSRATGDLRFLGYAESVLQPWLTEATVSADALVLHATILQSRHDFSAALSVIDRALQLRAADPQAWLTRATILRVLGHYDAAGAACIELGKQADSNVTALCTQSLRGLTGNLADAYAAVKGLTSQGMPTEERAWRDSELGEMAVRLGRDDEAEHWFKNGLLFAPADFYIRAAYADLLLRQQRNREVLALLNGRDSIEPLLLRIAIAQHRLNDPGLSASSARLAATFAAEAQRNDGVHRREQARFLLDVQNDPHAALNVALQNWQVQHESDDMLILVRAAKAAGSASKAQPVLTFVREQHVQDVRLAAATGGS